MIFHGLAKQFIFDGYCKQCINIVLSHVFLYICIGNRLWKIKKDYAEAVQMLLSAV